MIWRIVLIKYNHLLDYVSNSKKNGDNEKATSTTIKDNRSESMTSKIQKEEDYIQAIINHDKIWVAPDVTNISNSNSSNNN
jgi:hypothetical protein